MFQYISSHEHVDFFDRMEFSIMHRCAYILPSNIEKTRIAHQTGSDNSNNWLTKLKNPFW